MKFLEPYYKLTHYMLSDSTRKALLHIANAPDAFVDISYKISFFKLPSTIQQFNTTGLNCVCQMLRVSESGSKIHKDKNRFNEYENLWMPRQTVISFPLTDNGGATHFYDDDKNFVCDINYDGKGAILNTGECNHNVYFTEDNETRIVFQLCFEEKFSEVCNIYEKKLKDVIL
mgnify:CR=1 FL=1